MVALLEAGIGACERVWPQSPLLPRLYWNMCGLYIFRGIREGLAGGPGTESRTGGGAAAPVVCDP
jgi:hypothetical protein